jgi:hypothetical protein
LSFQAFITIKLENKNNNETKHVAYTEDILESEKIETKYSYELYIIQKMNCNEARTKLSQLFIDLKVAKENNAQRHKAYKEASRNYSLSGKEVERLEKEIKRLEQIIETENKFDSVNNVEGFNLLSNEELFAISIGFGFGIYWSRMLC